VLPVERREPELSVVVLSYRAEEHAGKVIEPLYDELEASGIPYELIAVANYWQGARDTTPQVVARLAEGRPAMRIVAGEKRGAMGFDMRSGLAAARGRYLVVIDGDGQVPVEYALQIHRLLRDGADVAKGRRHVREDGTARSLNSLAYNLLFRLLFRTAPLWDVNGRPKGLTRAAYDALDLRTDDWFADAEMILKARRLGLEIGELPVVFRANVARASFVGLDSLWEFAVNMVRWRLGTHPAQRPRASRARE
jgi:glycosyltransferase involved in cell wall biosynthesis